MNLQTAASALSQKFIRNHQESERIIKFLLDHITQDLAQGHRAYFRGFGAFKKTLRPARKYRNMKTNTIETRPPKKDIHFSPGKDLLKKAWA